MTIVCPTCKTVLDAGVIEASGFCSSCGEQLNVATLCAATCPICGCGFEECDEIRVCPDCKTPHHDECWTENHGCSTYGCASTAHQETHTSGGMSSGQGGESGMVACPACGAMHPVTDLVCGACGKLLGDNLSEDSSWVHLREAAGRNMSVVKTELIPHLARNFRLLGHDVAKVFRLWWGEAARYADFSGTTDREAFVAFTGVTSVGFALFSNSKWIVVVLILALLLPSLAICVRRLRDTDISPWIILAIPILPFLLLVPRVKMSNDVQQKESAT